MQFFTTAISFLAAALAVAPSALATPVQGTVKVTWDQTYDNADASLATVACSNGANGLLTKGFTTFGSLHNFLNIGGAAAVAGWNSAECGTCWKITYNGKSINILAIDHTDNGFNIGLKAMNDLTNNQATFLGRVNVVAEQANASDCGI